MTEIIRSILHRNKLQLYKVVPFDPLLDVIAPLDLSASNPAITPDRLNEYDFFNRYITEIRASRKALYLVGGYNELRSVYGRSSLFDAAIKAEGMTSKETSEPRRLHIGTDIWGETGTTVSAPLGGMVHSFAFNSQTGDYGATIILLHQLDGFPFYTLYGHLSLRDIEKLKEGQYVSRGDRIGHFGSMEENGYWPPHLHFQLISDMEMYRGDYPGVCRFSERKKYLVNCPDPDLILQMNQYFKKG